MPRDHGIPTAVAGFAPDSLLAALVLGAAAEARRPVLPRQLLPAGRAPRRQRDGQALHRRDDGRRRRATGAASAPSPNPATRCKPQYAQHDSRVRLPSYTEMSRKRAGEMPPGCDCAKVVLGRIYPERVPPVWCAPARRAIRSARAWCRTKAPAGSGGRTACARACGPVARRPLARRLERRQHRDPRDRAGHERRRAASAA